MTDLCFEVLAIPLFGEDMAEARPFVTAAAGALPYFPFGGGQRICIGNNFGLHEGVRVVAEVIRRFELKMANGSVPEPVLGITLLPREGSLRMEFRRRQAQAVARAD